MTLDGAINGVDHVESAPCRAAVFDVPGPDVEREEFRGQAACLHALDVGAVGRWRRAAQVEVVVGHRRSDVVVRVDDDGATLDLQGALPETLVTCLGGNAGYC